MYQHQHFIKPCKSLFIGAERSVTVPRLDKNDKKKTGSAGSVRPTAKMKSHLNIGVISIMTLICCAVIANLFKVSIV